MHEYIRQNCTSAVHQRHITFNCVECSRPTGELKLKNENLKNLLKHRFYSTNLLFCGFSLSFTDDFELTLNHAVKTVLT